MATVRSLALLVALIALSGCGSRTTPDTVSIAQLIPLTGADKIQGEHARNGARLAIDLAAKSDRRVFGKKVVVHHVDTRGEEEQVRAEAVRLITLNQVAGFLGGPGPAASMQLARTAQTYGVPALLSADLVELPTGEAVFCLNAAPEARGEALARYAAHDLSCHHVIALVDSEHAPGVALASGFVSEWRRITSGTKKAPVEEWPYSEESAAADLTARITGAKPDALLLATGPQRAWLLRSRLALPALKTVFLYGGEDQGTGPFEQPPDELPALYVVTSYSSGGKLAPEGESFVREYEEKFREKPDLPAALAYDGVRLFIDALDRAKTAAPGPLKDQLLAVREFPGVTGPLSLEDRRAKRRLFVAAVKGGEQKVVRTSGPGPE
jgi:branched-chain amino acid transport system substrate-binding protein